MENLPWHIPKRCNLLQVIGSLHIIKDLQLDGKKWTRSNTKKYNQSLGTWGLTKSGGSLSSTARETLEALIKYLGFLYIDNQRYVRITPAGYELAKEFRVFKKPEKKINLRKSEKIYNFTSSRVIKKQLFKLVISNPTIRERELDKDTALKPFIETLRYLVDSKVGFLSREEMAMFVFYQQSPRDYEIVKENILNFRRLHKEKRKKEIQKFASTYTGNKIYGESSATVKYWESIVKLSGLFDKGKTGFYLKDPSKNEACKIVSLYEYPKEDMFTNEASWWEYFGNPKINRYPRQVDYLMQGLKNFKLLFSYRPQERYFLEYFQPKLKVNGDDSVRIRVFPRRKYKFNLKILLNDAGKFTDVKFEKAFDFGKGEFLKVERDRRKLSSKPPRSVDYGEELKYMLSKNKLSSDYLNSIYQLLVLLNIVSNKQQAEEYIKNKMSIIKGGRFEKLFYELLRDKEEKGVIDKVIDWRGREDGGIYYPSPAGPGYETDIEFVAGNYYFGFELTTATGRAQWKTEAESVTDHIKNLKEKLESEKQKYKVVGIFTAPLITEFMHAICFYFSKFVYKIPIISIEGIKFFNILESSKNKRAFLKAIGNYRKKVI